MTHLAVGQVVNTGDLAREDEAEDALKVCTARESSPTMTWGQIELLSGLATMFWFKGARCRVCGRLLLLPKPEGSKYQIIIYSLKY